MSSRIKRRIYGIRITIPDGYITLNQVFIFIGGLRLGECMFVNEVLGEWILLVS
jgi:hypothetical protein